MVSNRALGNKFEREFCKTLSDQGFWVLNVPMSAAGQPADVIAVKDNTAFLIDCKVCSSKGFPLSRIEENQVLAMRLWEKCGNSHAWFAIRMQDGTIRMLSNREAIAYKQQQSRMSDGELRGSAISLKDWLNVYDNHDF